MPTEVPRILLKVRYYEAAQEYLRSLTLENHMEAPAQGTQRAITLASLALVHAVWAAFQVFNELLVQYPLPRQKKPGQVVPDNMVVVHDQPLEVDGSFDVPFQPARPFWVLEYVSRHNKRKDYHDNMEKYERHLKVPYYLLFYPDDQELTLFRHTGRKYVSVKPNEHGRYAIPELEIEVALLDTWVRYWFRGKLLPLPGELLQQKNEADHRAEEAQRHAEEARRHAEEERRARQAAEEEVARLRAELEQLRRRPKNNHR
jgi:hypothetical protein